MLSKFVIKLFYQRAMVLIIDTNTIFTLIICTCKFEQ